MLFFRRGVNRPCFAWKVLNPINVQLPSSLADNYHGYPHFPVVYVPPSHMSTPLAHRPSQGLVHFLLLVGVPAGRPNRRFEKFGALCWLRNFRDVAMETQRYSTRVENLCSMGECSALFMEKECARMPDQRTDIRHQPSKRCQTRSATEHPNRPLGGPRHRSV